LQAVAANASQRTKIELLIKAIDKLKTIESFTDNDCLKILAMS